MDTSVPLRFATRPAARQHLRPDVEIAFGQEGSFGSPPPGQLGIRSPETMEYRPAGSLGLDVGRPDYAAPFVTFFGTALAAVAVCTDPYVADQNDEPRLDHGNGE